MGKKVILWEIIILYEQENPFLINGHQLNCIPHRGTARPFRRRMADLIAVSFLMSP